MNAYQIGFLVGSLVGGALGVALIYKLFKSPNKINRILGGVLGLAGLSYVTSAWVQQGSERQREEFAEGFRGGCVNGCAQPGSDRALCTTFCDCQIAKILASKDADRLIENLRNVQSEADLAPDQLALVKENSIACMPAQLYDANFMNGCTGSCTGPTCSTSCRCILDKLREGMDAATGTQWLMKNIEVDPLTPEGQARADAATAACTAAAE